MKRYPPEFEEELVREWNCGFAAGCIVSAFWVAAITAIGALLIWMRNA